MVLAVLAQVVLLVLPLVSFVAFLVLAHVVLIDAQTIEWSDLLVVRMIWYLCDNYCTLTLGRDSDLATDTV